MERDWPSDDQHWHWYWPETTDSDQGLSDDAGNTRVCTTVQRIINNNMLSILIHAEPTLTHQISSSFHIIDILIWTQGELRFSNKSLSYVSQQAWIQNATLRDNILFSKSYDRRLFKQTVKNCALQTDLDLLPAGEMTEIGEKVIVRNWKVN